jgi:hypothetical protein
MVEEEMTDFTRRGFLKGLLATATLATAEVTGLGAVTRLRVADKRAVVLEQVKHGSSFSNDWQAHAHVWSAEDRHKNTVYDYVALIDESCPSAQEMIDFHEREAFVALDKALRG